MLGVLLIDHPFYRPVAIVVALQEAVTVAACEAADEEVEEPCLRDDKSHLGRAGVIASTRFTFIAIRRARPRCSFSPKSTLLRWYSAAIQSLHKKRRRVRFPLDHDVHPQPSECRSGREGEAVQSYESHEHDDRQQQHRPLRQGFRFVDTNRYHGFRKQSSRTVPNTRRSSNASSRVPSSSFWIL